METCYGLLTQIERLNGIGSERKESEGCGIERLKWTGKDWIGRDGTGMDRSGADCSGMERLKRIG